MGMLLMGNGKIMSKMEEALNLLILFQNKGGMQVSSKVMWKIKWISTTLSYKQFLMAKLQETGVIRVGILR